MGVQHQSAKEDDERKALLSAPQPAATKLARFLQAAGVAISWMSVSTIIILVNKHILKDLKFPYPMVVSSMGLVVSGCLSTSIVKSSSQTATKAITRQVWLTRVLPVGAFAASTMALGNMSYLYLGVSFIQMLKALSPIFTMLGLFMAGMEKPTASLISSVCIIAVGMALAAYGESNFSLLGVVILLGAEMCEAGRLVLTQHLLQGLNLGTFEGLMYMAPASFAWLIGAAAITEFPRIFATGALAVPRAHLWEFGVSACLGFAVTALGYATIKLTNSLTLKVLGNVRNVATILAAVALFGEVVTVLQVLGYGISIGGFAYYTHLKMQPYRS